MKLTITREMTVKPAEPTWTGTQSLSELDQIGSMKYPGVVYFYGPPAKPFGQITETLIESLSQVLVPFFPVAGRLRSIGHGGRFELLCNGKGVVFITAEISETLASFAGDFTPSEALDEHLIPSIENYGDQLEETPLFLTQLTRFECGSLGLSVSMSHVIADGEGGQMFAMEWARLARGEPLLRAPFLQRAILGKTTSPPRYFDHSKDFCCLPFLLNQPSAEETAKTRTAVVSLRLSRDQVESLKNAANKNISSTRRYSRYESLAAHIWRCLSKARKHEDEQPTGFLVTVDTRNRVEPPLPPGYFGNAVLDVTATCRAGDLVSSPLGFGASKIRAAIEKVTSEYVSSALDFLRSEEDLTKYQYSYTSSTNGGGKFGGNPNVNVVNWVNLPLHGVDFGWGKEIRFVPEYERVDGDCLIIGSSNGDGSLHVVMCLIQDHVKSFQNHFYDDILDV